MVATMVRPDPWSGKMTVALCDMWTDILIAEGLDVNIRWQSVIEDIQNKYATELLPEEVKEILQ